MQHERAGDRYWEPFEELTGVSLPNQGVVNFVLPDIKRDLRKGVYMTMKLAEMAEDPLITSMYTTECEFFWRLEHEHLSPAREGDAEAYRSARARAAFPEAPELRMGYAANSWKGRAVGDGEVNERFVDELKEYRGVSLAICEEPDAMGFIDQIGLDRASDAHATICKQQLIEFTQTQARMLGFRAGCMKEVSVPNVWNPEKDSLVTVSAELPVTQHDRPILLVPRRIVRSNFPVRAEQYADYHGLQGTDSETLKRLIMEQNRDSPGRILRAMRHRVFDDPKKFMPRRDMRDDEEGGSSGN